MATETSRGRLRSASAPPPRRAAARLRRARAQPPLMRKEPVVRRDGVRGGTRSALGRVDAAARRQKRTSGAQRRAQPNAARVARAALGPRARRRRRLEDLAQRRASAAGIAGGTTQPAPCSRSSAPWRRLRW